MPPRTGSAMAATRAAVPCSATRRGSKSARRLPIAGVIARLALQLPVRMPCRFDRAHRRDFGNKKERAPGGTHSQKPTGWHPTVMRYPKAGHPKYSDLRRRRKGRGRPLTGHKLPLPSDFFSSLPFQVARRAIVNLPTSSVWDLRVSVQASHIPELDDLIERGSPGRRATTLERMTAFFLDGASRFNDDHVRLFDFVFSRLIGEI